MSIFLYPGSLNHRNSSVLEALKRFLSLIDYPRLHQHTACDFQLGLDIHCLMRTEGECFSAFLDRGVETGGAGGALAPLLFS